MRRFASLLLFLSSASAGFALPDGSLSTEYTINGSESLSDQVYAINNTGILNVGSSAGAGTLTYNHSAATNSQLLLTVNGTINIGTDTVAGLFNFKGAAGEGTDTGPYLSTVRGTGTVNINKMGEYRLDGYNRSFWGVWASMPSNTNVYGKITIAPAETINSYFGIQNLNLYAGGTISSSKNCIMMNADKSVWNLYSAGLKAQAIRVGLNSGYTNYINLYENNALKDVTDILYSSQNVTLNVNVKNSSQTFNKISFMNNSTLNFALAQDKSGLSFNIKTLSLAYQATGTNVKMTFQNFQNDFVHFENVNGISIVDNKIYLTGLNYYIDLTAYLGDSTGTAIDGNWTLVSDTVNGGFFLNNSAIPEPAVWASILGAMALALGISRKSKK